ncbi:hypothetical protein C0989_005082 [Termitomyces sp. Mn162]|nr:hypothetical protein C0989_005082 [Termitomyces sp. Mn162]
MPTPPSPLVVASILTGVPAALWAYKCAMMVLFQRKIIYMGYAPLGARTDRLADTRPTALPCSELRIPASISALQVGPSAPNLVILYLQGNAGNPLHRIPVFHSLLSVSPPYTSILAPAPRSYWSSPGRPTQPGILADYTAALTHTLHQFPNARVVLYGHSLGGAAALCLLAQPNLSSLLGKDADRLRGVILENPFTSVPAMIKALYPQKWLPYRYLTPFVWDRWDALGAVEKLDGETSLLRRLCGRMLVLTSERDEVVPKEMGAAIVRAVSDKSRGNREGESLRTRLVVIRGALHEDGWTRKGWEDVVGVYLRGIVDETKTIDG